MKTYQLLILFVLMSLIKPVPLAQGETLTGVTDVEAIKALMVQTTDAFNRHDAKAWAGFCTSDAQLVTVRGESLKGVAEIEKGLARIFETRGREAKLKTLDVTIRFIRPDVALAYLTNEMSGVIAADGGALPPHRELSVRVLVKERGEWSITAFHNTIVQESGAASH